MSENVRTILLDISGYHIKVVGDSDVGSASAQSVVFKAKFDDTWEGMAITANFTDAANDHVTHVLLVCQQDEDGRRSFAMPSEVTEYEGNALLSFSGVRTKDEFLTTAEIVQATAISGITVDTSTFAAAVDEVPNVYFFSKDASGWHIGSSADVITLSTYGITVSGTETIGDKFAVRLARVIDAKQTTKPFSFRVYASQTECPYNNAAPITPTDAEQLHEQIFEAEAWAVGTKHGEAVEDGDAQYENNAKYYAEQPVTTDRIADGAVTAAKLGAKAVETAKIDDEAVTAAKLGTSAVETAKIAGGAVTEDKIAANAVTYNKIAPGAVHTSAIEGGAVRWYELASNVKKSIAGTFDSTKDYKKGDYAFYATSITSDPNLFRAKQNVDAGSGWDSSKWERVGIATDSASFLEDIQISLREKYVLPQYGVPTADIADGAVTEAKIEDGAVTDEKLGSKAVKTANIDDGAVGNDQLASAVKTTIAGKADSSALAASGGAALIGVIPPDGSQGVTSVQGYFYALEENGAYYIHALDNDGVTLIRVQDYLDRLAATVAAKIDRSEALPAVYNAYATEGVSSATRFRTLLGADGLPVKAATVKQTAGTPTTWVIRRCGQNLLNPDMIFLRKSSVSGTNGLQLYDGSETQRALALSAEYIPITPGARLVTRGLTNTVGSSVMYYAAFYAADKSFISRYIPPDTRIDWATTAPEAAAFVRICIPIQYVSTITEKTGKLLSNRQVQLEMHSNPSATIADATEWEAYNGEDTIVTVTALDVPTAPQAMPTTVIGQNNFSLFPQGALTDANPATAIDLITATATMDVTYRLDPTLAYDNLKAAIVAAGS